MTQRAVSRGLGSALFGIARASPHISSHYTHTHNSSVKTLITLALATLTRCSSESEEFTSTTWQCTPSHQAIWQGSHNQCLVANFKRLLRGNTSCNACFFSTHIRELSMIKNDPSCKEATGTSSPKIRPGIMHGKAWACKTNLSTCGRGALENPKRSFGLLGSPVQTPWTCFRTHAPSTLYTLQYGSVSNKPQSKVMHGKPLPCQGVRIYTMSHGYLQLRNA